MREIKFRAYQDNQMLHSPLSSNYGLTRFFGMLYEDAPIMQFTGLKDKDEKEIYEGDILHDCGVEHGATYEVKWEDSFFAGYDIDKSRKMFLHGFRFKESKVIGNIHENPEAKAGAN